VGAMVYDHELVRAVHRDDLAVYLGHCDRRRNDDNGYHACVKRKTTARGAFHCVVLNPFSTLIR
jgi:hypothetical protein